MSTTYEQSPEGERNPFAQYEPAPPIDEPAPRHDWMESTVARRTLLSSVIGVSAIGGLLRTAAIADTAAGILIYGSGPPEIGVVPDAAAEKKFPSHFNVVAGGFGVYNIADLAGHVHEGMKNFGQTAYIKNSNSGLQIDTQKDMLLDFLKERNADTVNLYGHSMAGMEIVEIGHFLLKHNIQVQSVMLDCSPERKYDVRPSKRFGAELLAFIDRMSDDIGVSGGPGARVAFETISRVLDGRRDWGQIVKEALAKVDRRNASDKLLESQALYICAFNGAEYGPDFPSATVVGKLRPKMWEADQTVNNQTALVGWRVDAFPQLAVDDVPIVGGGHANPGAAGAQYTPTLMRWGREKNLYDGTPGTLMSPNRRAI